MDVTLEVHPLKAESRVVGHPSLKNQLRYDLFGGSIAGIYCFLLPKTATFPQQF